MPRKSIVTPWAALQYSVQCNGAVYFKAVPALKYFRLRRELPIEKAGNNCLCRFSRGITREELE